MDSSEILSLLRLAPAIFILAYASVLDWRTRRVPNPYWIALCVIGLLILALQVFVDEKDLGFILIMVPILAVLSDVFWSSEADGPLAKFVPIAKYCVTVASILVLAYLWGSDEYFQHLLAIPLVMMFIVVLYFLDVIRGGADAKALISMSIMFPFYPTLGSLPLVHSDTPSAEILFPFSLLMLFTAAVVVVLVPLGFLVKNLIAREFVFPLAFLGYKADIESIDKKHIWLMERIRDGRHVTSIRTIRDEDLGRELEELAKAGYRKIWVTPKIPFIVPITVGLILSTIIGNWLFYLLSP